jgi:hypothetical protein
MNWGELKAAVAAYTHRSDLTALMPTFLELAEQRIYYGEANSPKLRCAAMHQAATLADGTRPAGFLEAIKITPTGHPARPLGYRPITHMPHECHAFSWDGATLVLSSDQAFPVDLTYYARLVTPVADSDTNWLMDSHPGIYLSSMLVEFARWSVDEAMGAREASNYASAVTALNSAEKAAAFSGSLLTMKAAR